MGRKSKGGGAGFRGTAVAKEVEQLRRKESVRACCKVFCRSGCNGKYSSQMARLVRVGGGGASAQGGKGTDAKKGRADTDENEDAEESMHPKIKS